MNRWHDVTDSAMTFSVVAHDATTGELGVAAASCTLAVGRAVVWGRAGIGVVATQAHTRRGYGPRGLDRLAAGQRPDAAMTDLLGKDSDPGGRQVAMLSAAGMVAAHTGEDCVSVATHQTGDGWSAQGNMLAGEQVVPAMATALATRSDVPLAERLMAALVAGERAGGDLRGRQSAALLVVGPKRSGEPWDEVPIDLRVDDSRDPLGELGRLLLLQRAYEQSDSATLALLGPAGPRDIYAVMAAARRGDLDTAKAAVAELRSRPGWEDWLRAGAESGRFPYLSALLD